MGKLVLSVFFGLAFVVAGVTSSFAQQSGGMNQKTGKWSFVSDSDQGMVVGMKYAELDVNVDLYAMDIGGIKTWYPPVSILRLAGRAGRPVVIKVTNKSSAEHGFHLSADSAYAAPTDMNIKVVLKPGQTKWIGIPISDLTYVTAGGLLRYKCHLHEKHLGGYLLIQK